MPDDPGQDGPKVKLNPLAYQILGVIARHPTSGYDVVKALHRFRPVKVSQVYQSLSIMESADLVTVSEVVQHGKPNKRIHAITPRGSRVLNNWIARTTSHPGTNDEFVRKAYSLWHAPAGQRRALVADRQAWLRGEIDHFERMQDKLLATAPGRSEDPECWEFSRRILLMRRLALCREELRWCQSVLDLLCAPTPKTPDTTSPEDSR